MPQLPDHGRAASSAVKLGAHVVELALASSGRPPEWLHVVPAGTFAFRDGRGPYVLSDPAAVVAASRAGSLGGGLPVDYDHAIDYAAPKGLPAPAAGWIEALEARHDGIWSRVTWTDRAAASIAALEYRFLSPTFQHDAAGRVVRVLRAALTNNPAIPNLTALASLGPAELDPMELARRAVAHQRQVAGIGMPVTAAAAVRFVQATTEIKPPALLLDDPAALARLAGEYQTRMADLGVIINSAEAVRHLLSAKERP